jgi:hypothetical protein
LQRENKFEEKKNFVGLKFAIFQCKLIPFKMYKHYVWLKYYAFEYIKPTTKTTSTEEQDKKKIGRKFQLKWFNLIKSYWIG